VVRELAAVFARQHQQPPRRLLRTQRRPVLRGAFLATCSGQVLGNYSALIGRNALAPAATPQ
jgi:hypothetical protein